MPAPASIGAPRITGAFIGPPERSALCTVTMYARPVIFSPRVKVLVTWAPLGIRTRCPGLMGAASIKRGDGTLKQNSPSISGLGGSGADTGVAQGSHKGGVTFGDKTVGPKAFRFERTTGWTFVPVGEPTFTVSHALAQLLEVGADAPGLYARWFCRPNVSSKRNADQTLSREPRTRVDWWSLPVFAGGERYL